ncbi:inositol monophosphatase [Paenibacillus alginolyticus]|uniref:inositol monophosphatase family protein n=1 Tax=Paenibacillus alginolyticus TaxID=59839 RepID=UPI0004926D13|nr:inositol monophosphatase family protein [Paenibacillus alginolyticus]MCY9666293.1 inositol monophosphatase [Paenibacillus alginolyticus]
MVNSKVEPFVVGSKSFTAVAINTAAKAGQWIKSKLGDINRVDTKYSSQDLVTEVDKGSEKLIRNLIMTHFPDHSILGEEGVEPGPEASARALQAMSDEEYLWIVDPIDGTTNFVHGFPFYSVSIALAHKGEIIVGVVYDPSRDELFVAEKGKGAYMHGNKTTVSLDSKLSESLVATGFPADRECALPINLRGTLALAPKVRNLRSGGSAALHMAYVAAGRLSGFWEIGLSAWDVAAGSLLIQESGGKVSDTAGNPYQLSVRNVLATNGQIHNELQQELAGAGATGL